ncbi:pilus assembly PilX family protein [Alishewanella longhuensis]
MLHRLKQQSGVALVVTLLLLVAITVLTISSMQRSTLQERMTANLYEHQLFVQQAESALRAAENVLQGLLPNPATAAGVVQGFYGLPVAGQTDRWLDPQTIWVDPPAVNEMLDLQAHYIIEYVGDWPTPAAPDCDSGTTIEPDCLSPTFRITARTQPADNRPGVVMQTIWRL